MRTYIAKNFKISRKYENILVIGYQGSGVFTRLIEYNKSKSITYYQSVSEMTNNRDKFIHYDCIVFYSCISQLELRQVKDFIFDNILFKDKRDVPLSYYLPDMSLDISECVVLLRKDKGYKAYKREKLPVMK